MIFKILLLILISVAGCGEKDSQISQPAKSPEINLGQFNDHLLCRATISALMDAEPKNMNFSKAQDHLILSYNRESDGKFWEYKCKREDKQILWGSKSGRWRTHPADGKVTFKVDAVGDTVEIIESYSDGSSSSHEFRASELQQS